MASHAFDLALPIPFHTPSVSSSSQAHVLPRLRLNPHISSITKSATINVYLPPLERLAVARLLEPLGKSEPDEGPESCECDDEESEKHGFVWKLGTVV